MDFGQVEAFVQVSAHSSFSRAAEVLQLTQPSITARIQSLEREVGEELFERDGRGVRMTDAGLAFLPYAERILRTLVEGRDAIDEVRNVQLGSLLLGSALTVSTYVLPRILHAFRSQYGGVDVSIRTGRSEQVLAMLQADEVHVGIVRSLSHPDVETVHLYDDEIVLSVNPEHPFAASGTATVEDAASEPIVLFDRGSSYFGLIPGFFRQSGSCRPTSQWTLLPVCSTRGPGLCRGQNRRHFSSVSRGCSIRSGRWHPARSVWRGG